MYKITNIRFSFFYADKPESDSLLINVYSRIFQKAFENLMRNSGHEPIIKPNKPKNEN
ncbi:MAG: hypothetical protein ACD_19C00426G0127 [uncultured bacterium]|nr:MAG: hypothetical protein ACD_19C00426G0127 [uncultured bacterium]